MVKKRSGGQLLAYSPVVLNLESAINSRRLLSVLLLLLIFSLPAGSTARAVGHARMLEQSGQLPAALDRYRSLIEREPGNLSVYSGLKRVAVQLERFDLLDSISERLVGLYPERTEYRLGRVQGLLGRGRSREAVQVARGLLERRPEHIVVVVEILENAGELRSATELLKEYRAVVGEPAVGRRLIDLYERQQLHAEAARELVNMVIGNPRFMAELLPRLREYGAQSGWRGVLAEVRKLPDGAIRSRAEAELFIGSGREAEAVAAARAGMSRDELYGFAHTAEEAGALRAALAIFEELDLPAQQARVLRELGRVDEAVKLLSRDPSPRARFELAQLERLVRKDYAAAARSYDEILNREPGNVDAVWGLAVSRLALGDTARARQALAGLSRPADSVLALRVRLAFYAGADDSLRAHSNQLIARFPQSRHINEALELLLLVIAGEQSRLIARAMLVHETGQSDSALAIARDIAQSEGDAAEKAFLFIARVLAETGRLRDSYVQLEKFPERFPDSPRRARALYEQSEAAGAMGDARLQVRHIEELVLEYPYSPYAILGRTARTQLLTPADPSQIR